jgi:predicted nucleotidyltransferase
MLEIKNIPPSLRKRGLTEKLLKLCEENDVVFMAIFGSFVRGEQKKKSDIDVLIKYRNGSRKSLLDLVGLEMKLSQLFRRKVDLGEIEALNKHVKNEILTSMRVIYEKG